MSNELKSDEIFIDSLECFTLIGINDWEKKTKQLVVIDIPIFIHQIPNKNKRTASINIITHKTVEKRITNCLRKLKKNKHIISSPTFIRVGDINDN